MPLWPTMNSFKCPAFTSWSKWSLNTLHCSVVWPFSRWEVQYRLIECHIYPFISDFRLFFPGFPYWPLLEAPEMRVPVILRGHRYLSLTLLPIILQPLVLFNPPHKLCMFLGGRIVKDSLNFDSWRSPNLNVLATTCSFSLPISLYNS